MKRLAAKRLSTDIPLRVLEGPKSVVAVVVYNPVSAANPALIKAYLAASSEHAEHVQTKVPLMEASLDPGEEVVWTPYGEGPGALSLEKEDAIFVETDEEGVTTQIFGD